MPEGERRSLFASFVSALLALFQFVDWVSIAPDAIAKGVVAGHQSCCP